MHSYKKKAINERLLQYTLFCKTINIILLPYTQSHWRHWTEIWSHAKNSTAMKMLVKRRLRLQKAWMEETAEHLQFFGILAFPFYIKHNRIYHLNISDTGPVCFLTRRLFFLVDGEKQLSCPYIVSILSRLSLVQDS